MLRNTIQNSNEMEYVIFEKGIDNMMSPERKNYREFIRCVEGRCDIVCNDKTYILTKNNCALIITRFLQKITPSSDFKCEVIYIENGFLRQSEPNHPYIIQGALSLCMNPVLNLEPDEQELCRLLFYNFNLRIQDRRHKFYDEILRTSARMLILDLFDMHARAYNGEALSPSASEIMTKFIDMLSNKEYRDNREVAYYARELGVVPKYLSEISNKTSGFSASYWINRFTSYDINQLLREKKMSSAEIARLFHFTSTSYFNRYVKRYLGAYPNELRAQ